jgi:hypothetical protein
MNSLNLQRYEIERSFGCTLDTHEAVQTLIELAIRPLEKFI